MQLAVVKGSGAEAQEPTTLTSEADQLPTTMSIVSKTLSWESSPSAKVVLSVADTGVVAPNIGPKCPQRTAPSHPVPTPLQSATPSSKE